MKQWIKYTAVVCGFFMMVVLFFPYSGSGRVIASEGGTVSGENVAVASEEGADETGTVPWTVTININVDENVTTTIAPAVSGELFGFTTESAPTKDGYEFIGWLCSVTGENNAYDLHGKTLGAGEWTGYLYNCTDYTGATITLTAQWTWTGSEIAKSGTYTLGAAQPYTLGEGTWTVEEDNSNSSYSGEIQFYVPSDGSYTFNSN